MSPARSRWHLCFGLSVSHGATIADFRQNDRTILVSYCLGLLLTVFNFPFASSKSQFSQERVVFDRRTTGRRPPRRDRHALAFTYPVLDEGLVSG